MIVPLVLIVAFGLLLAAFRFVIRSLDPYCIRMRAQSRVQRHAVRRSRELADLRFEVRRDARRLLRDLERDIDGIGEE